MARVADKLGDPFPSATVYPWERASMRFSMSRHLADLFAEREPQTGPAVAALSAAGVRAKAEPKVKSKTPPPEFNALDYVAFLLDVDAEIEHSLMVQYLYGAYSLGGPQVPEQYRDLVRGWQEVVLGIAKEEMGHLISVQNVLRLIGAPLNFNREDYPADTPFYPYPFALEPLTPAALAKYVFAESPADWKGPLADEVKKLLPKTARKPHRVGELFEELIGRVKDPDFLGDDVFQPETWPYQAKWDEWGRGYSSGARGNSEGAGPPATPDVFVKAVASRDEAVSSLKDIAEQGEACPSADTTAPSHFARFLKIFREMKDLEPVWKKGKWTPWRNVAVNPFIPADGEDSGDDGADAITHPEAVAWGHLFNIRYRMALSYLTHSFDLAGGLNETAPGSPRGTIISAAFGEMYNLRSIAAIMVRTPLSKSRSVKKFAGPPFQVPYTMHRPAGEANRWRLHRNLLEAASPLVDKLLSTGDSSRHAYLRGLREADRELLETIDRILEGLTNLVPR
jgi:hypothetical protein